MRIHDDLTTEGFDMPPVAPGTGPLPGQGFLSAWNTHLGAGATMVIVEDETALLGLVETQEAFEFAGSGSVTDYHTPLGEGAADLLATFVADVAGRKPIRFDSLPLEAADVVAAGLQRAGMTPETRQHEAAPVLDLPASYDEYLADLGKKARHESRRKRRRFETALGPPRLERLDGEEAVSAFAAMHRRSHGTKGAFMDDAKEAFFGGLHEQAGGLVDALFGDDGMPAAMAFGFEDADTYYFYNSAYEPAWRDHSPGMVLIEMVIRHAIAQGLDRLDLLKGDEDYKIRLGAVARPLFEVSTAGGAA